MYAYVHLILMSLAKKLAPACLTLLVIDINLHTSGNGNDNTDSHVVLGVVNVHVDEVLL